MTILMYVVITAGILFIGWIIYERSTKNSATRTTTTVVAAPATGTATTVVTKTTWVQYARSHWIKTALCIIGLLALIFWGPSWISNIRGTTTQQVVHVAPPTGKSVGGPLRWNDAAKVRLRDRVSREELDSNGVCFAGIIPPGSFTDASYVAYMKERTDWSAFLVDFTSSGSFLPPEVLLQRGTSREGKPVGIFKMPELSSKGRYENRFSNDTDQTSPKILECYIQVAGQGPNVVHVTHQGPKDTFQYVVEIGVNETSFTLPHQSWKWLWIAPVRHKAYQASWQKGDPIPVEGGKDGLLGLRIEINGEEEALDHAYLLQPEDLKLSSKVKVAFSVPEDMRRQKITDLKPARVIVGIQM